MPTLDPKKAKEAKANIAFAKMALKKAEVKDKDGNGVRVGFAFSPGKDKNDHIFLINPRKKGQALMAEIRKGHPDRKVLCCGHATVVKDGGKKTMSIVYVKKLGGAERKMQEALKAMSLMYRVQLEKEDEAEDIAEDVTALEEAVEDEAGDQGDAPTEDADDDDDRRPAAGGDDKDAETAGDDEDEDDDEGDEDETETADADEEADAPTAAVASKGAPPAAAAKLAALGAAPKVWHQTRGVMAKSIENLRAAIKKEYASEAPELNAEIDKGMAQMDRIMARLDHQLAEQMDKAHKAKDEATRKAELAKAHNILKEHIKYVQSEPLIAHIDANPFGVQTNLKKTLMMSFTHVAKVIS
jgi:hypothetical protein